MTRTSRDPAFAQSDQHWSTIFGAAAAVAFVRYFILSLWHLWSLSRGRGGLSPLGPADDGDYYLQTARDIGQGWTGTVVANVYPQVMGQVMRITGVYAVFFYKHINLLGGLATIAVAGFVYSKLRRWGDAAIPDEADATSMAALLILFGIYASAIAYEEFTLTRDGWIYLLHVLAVALSLEIGRRRGILRLTLIFVLAPLLLWLFKLRFYAPIGFGAGVIGWWTWHALRQRYSAGAVVSILSTLLAAALFVMLVVSKALAARFPLAAVAVAFNAYRSGDYMNGGSSLGIDLMGAPVPLQFPLFIYSAVSNAVGPLPWQIRSVGTAAGFLAEVPMLFFVLLRIWRMRDGITRASSFLLWQAIAWFLVIGYFNDNLGTAFRLRVLGWHALFILYAVLRQREVDQNLQRSTGRLPTLA